MRGRERERGRGGVNLELCRQEECVNREGGEGKVYIVFTDRQIFFIFTILV